MVGFKGDSERRVPVYGIAAWYLSQEGAFAITNEKQSRNRKIANKPLQTIPKVRLKLCNEFLLPIADGFERAVEET